MQPKLSIELVPKTAFYSNVRAKVSKEKWDQIRKKCYSLAQNKCQVCGDTGYKQGAKHPVECHEIWQYDEMTQTQKLKGFIALCPLCHTVKHFGYAQLNGKEDIAKQHLAKVNGWNMREVSEYIGECWGMWQHRNKIDWKLDISFMDVFLDEPAELPMYNNPDAEIW